MLHYYFSFSLKWFHFLIVDFVDLLWAHQEFVSFCLVSPCAVAEACTRHSLAGVAGCFSCPLRVSSSEPHLNVGFPSVHPKEMMGDDGSPSDNLVEWPDPGCKAVCASPLLNRNVSKVCGRWQHFHPLWKQGAVPHPWLCSLLCMRHL